ncbi:MAG: hypothetical protein ACI89X_003842, partial [Planctomycetota bacterium]
MRCWLLQPAVPVRAKLVALRTLAAAVVVVVVAA